MLQPGCQSGRADIAQSVDVLIRNSNLAAIPNTSEAVGKLRNVQFIVNVGKGPLSGDEFSAVCSRWVASPASGHVLPPTPVPRPPAEPKGCNAGSTDGAAAPLAESASGDAATAEGPPEERGGQSVAAHENEGCGGTAVWTAGLQEQVVAVYVAPRQRVRAEWSLSRRRGMSVP